MNIQTSASQTFLASDPASLALTISHTGNPPFGTLSGSTFTFAPTSFVDLGTYTVVVKACNTIDTCTNSSFTVVFTNTAPSFSAPSTTIVTTPVTIPKTYNLPSYSDLEGDSITFSTYLDGTNALPDFISYSSGTYTITPTLNSQIGAHVIIAKICDGQPLCSTLQFTVRVLEAQNPIIVNPQNTIVTANLQTPGTLFLDFSDPLGLDCTVIPFFITDPGIPAFASFDSGTNTYTFAPTQYSE